MATPRRPSDDELAELIRVESRQVLATLIRFLGDIDQAEEALHDAVVAATDAWRRDGAPDRPGAWLSTVARNKALDHVRREARRADREAAAVALRGPVDDTDTATDPLRLLFTCCHPALAPEAQMALALRTLCGLTTVEIARVFLVPDGTIGQRITRAKAKIARARIPYRVPSDDELPDRLRPVLATIAAMFTVGHHPPAGPLDGRVDLADDAVRLGRLLVALMPDDPEAAGLLALMLAQHARRATRLDEHGDAVLLADQDRSRWDRGMIAEAAALVESSLRRGRVGPFQLQAAIGCLHDLAPTWDETDWPQIAVLYRMLEQRQPTAVVRVTRAVAEAEAYGPRNGLRLLADLDPATVERWHLYWAAVADFHRRLDEPTEARAAYRRALACPCNDTDRRFLERRLGELPNP